jgi:hypothetical protein
MVDPILPISKRLLTAPSGLMMIGYLLHHHHSKNGPSKLQPPASHSLA